MTKYLIHAIDPTTARAVQKVFEAESGAEARRMAEAIGLDVKAVEVHAPAAAEAASDPFSAPTAQMPLGPEKEVWSGTPSQWTNFWWFVLCVLVIPIPWAIWRWLVVRNTRYTLTTQRIKLETGVFSKELEEVELYRVKDTDLDRPFIQRLLGLGTVRIMSSDATMPEMKIPAVPDAIAVREHIRKHVELARRARGVRELDVT